MTIYWLILVNFILNHIAEIYLQVEFSPEVIIDVLLLLGGSLFHGSSNKQGSIVFVLESSGINGESKSLESSGKQIFATQVSLYILDTLEVDGHSSVLLHEGVSVKGLLGERLGESGAVSNVGGELLHEDRI